ncbi:MAG: DegT/DnrJ/EryC1/StrS family aminotransferase [Candidatus Omnitrophota bacterium]
MHFIDLQKQYYAYQSEIDAAINKVVHSTQFIMGPEVSILEKELSAFTNNKHALACSSGTDALLLALMAFEVKPGDEIITTPFSFIAAAEVIAFLKARPVFVDIDPQTYNIDPEKIGAAVTSKTKGIIPVDIFGQCADYDQIRAIAAKHRLFLVEDGAQSFGAEYKGRQACSLGDISCTSFFPAKPLGCFGDGGALFTDNTDLARKIDSLRVHGKGSHKYDHAYIGINGRLDTLQAAILSVKLKHFHQEIEARNHIADYYTQHLKGICVTPFIESHNLSVYAQYVIQLEERDRLQAYLTEKVIPTAIHYPKPLHLQPALQYLGYHEGDFPVAEKLCEKVLALPMHPFLSGEEQDLVICAIKEGLRIKGLKD